MARKRRTRKRSGKGPDSTKLLLVAVVALALFIAIRNANEDEATAGTTTTTAPPAATTSTAPPKPAPPGQARSAAELLGTLTVQAEGPRTGYEREAFGDGWQRQSNGCDTREQVLASESKVPAKRGADGCSVVSGQWVSIYDNYSTPRPEDLEIDHVVALAEAWESGARDWPAARRVQYANDLDRPDALIAVTSSTNQSKSDRDPADWMPPNRGAWCRFADAWITQKAAWHLTIDPAERDALRNVLATC
jgi:hypothetical protein